MIDIYNKLATDQNYKPALETTDEMEMILQQIKMILGTNNGDVLGDPYFGVNIKKYIFSMGYDQKELNDLVTVAIIGNINYDKQKYNVQVTVDFGKDRQNGYDYAVINVSINQIKRLGIMINQ